MLQQCSIHFHIANLKSKAWHSTPNLNRRCRLLLECSSCAQLYLFHGVDTVFKFLTKAHQLLRLNPLFSSFCPCGGILVSHSVSPAQVGNHHIGHGGDAISITPTKVTSEYSRDQGRFPPA
ncbi:hypothetical protein FOXG_19554 [Fusarium oxysporum f. sp. lycopersici 4287]|uniref:Uncharacterized protein n=2 Tax=Fusarium oxysporum TaxID=5507 RepID=A0A0J9V3F5_FUSO4|nr:hypothetical protein FOXG_19554 [Fusarium oxysporum f. sp. lycopersici 4287]EXK45327.1 hypothetical protein FOMG_03802 [Fusarium oxysporum f. sp. melonis 26406]KNB05825.1 hypothetical protein FOXG_19554 [Fusarium oxysporum f. sp. lycopersici 4287]